MENIRDNLAKVQKNLKDGVLLVAVTKTHTAMEINEALDKYDKVKPVRWHMIGHLQTNKVKYIIDKVSLIHSVDSMKLAQEIQKQAQRHGITMDILIQVNAAGEESKFGIEPGSVKELIMEILDNCPNVNVKGLMFVAPFAEDPEEVRGYFAQVAAMYNEYSKISHQRLDFRYLSMGMSHDYLTAMEEGANLVRVGSTIFGSRVY